MNNIVVKNISGMASAVAASVDSSMRNEFLGSIAGDDTLLIIARNEEKAAEIAEKLIQLFPVRSITKYVKPAFCQKCSGDR